MFRKLPALPTLKSLPQAIGLPFLSTQEDAQLRFKSESSGIKRLYGDEIIPVSDVEYWSQFYSLFGSAADVYSLISVQDVRQALTNQPTNLANLISILSSHLFTLLPSPLFPTTANNSSPQDPTRQALNCLRVLGRILVVVYEAEADHRDATATGADRGQSFAQKYLWSRDAVDPVLAVDEASAIAEGRAEINGQSESDAGEQFKIEDSDSEEEKESIDEGARAFKATVGKPPKTDSKQMDGPVDDPLSRPDGDAAAIDEEEPLRPCLVDRLFSCTIDLLFCAGFTVPESVRSQSSTQEKVNYVIWEKGVGSTVSIGSSADLDRNKSEVLRFLTILLSTTIYSPPNTVLSTPNLALEHLTHSLERRLVLSLLCSFLNTSLTRSKASSTISSIGNQLPYNHLISKAEEERRTLVRSCLTTLLVALDYRVPESQTQMGEGKDENAFRYFVSKLHRKEDFSFVLGGITAILEEHLAIQNGFLPGSQKPIPYILEAYMLLWRMVDLNKRFRTHVFDSGKAPDVIACILLTCLEMKEDPAHHGLLRLLSYLLQTLSADSAFAGALNQTPRVAIPAKWAVSGSLADFFIVSIYSIATTPGLNPLFPALTISIANAAPYLQNIGVQASTRLLQLFKAFSSPNFLLADDGHPRLVYYLLETFNHVLYHQLNENPHLVYAILRAHNDFNTLANFTLMSGLREIKRRQAMKAKLAAETTAGDTRPGIRRTNSELEMLAEKAALLGKEDEEHEDEARSSSRGQSRQASPPLPSPPIDLSAPPTIHPLTTPGDGPTMDPLSSTPTVEIPEPPFAPVLSEKARGKMRARDSISSLTNPDLSAPDVPDEDLLRIAEAGVGQAGVGPNGFVPTQEWVSSWQKGLPLDPVLVAISELLPKVQDTQSRTGAPSSKVFNILKGASISEVLPPNGPIVPRKFQWSSASCIWLTSLLWGDIYVAGLSGGIWRDTKVRLFGVKQAPVKGRGAQVERMLKRLGVA